MVGLLLGRLAANQYAVMTYKNDATASTSRHQSRNFCNSVSN
jgi:hypothetical protein